MNEITVPFPNSQPITVDSDTAGLLLVKYYPEQMRKLLEKALIKAQKDHRLSLDKQYHAVFTED